MSPKSASDVAVAASPVAPPLDADVVAAALDELAADVLAPVAALLLLVPEDPEDPQPASTTANTAVAATVDVWSARRRIAELAIGSTSRESDRRDRHRQSR
jgi:hypothetical protein